MNSPPASATPAAVRIDALSAGALSHDPSGVVSFWAARSPALIALHEGEQRLSYGEVDRQVSVLAATLQDSGIATGDRVAIIGENEAAVVIAILAAWRAGAWAVPLNARYAPPELAAILTHADPRLILATSAAVLRHGAVLGGSMASVIVAGLHMSGRAEASPETSPAGGERVVLMLYTSGTTGTPKGVMLPLRALAFMAGLWATRPVTVGDRVYQALPLSHSFGLCSNLFGALNLGCEVELVSRYDPEQLRQSFVGGLTLFQGVPAMYARYLQHLDARALDHHAPALKVISSGGAPLDPTLKQRVDARFGLSLRQAFGMTEAGPTVTVPDPATQAATALGRPAPGAAVRLIDGDGNDGDGPGEMWVRTPGAMVGYFRDPAATAQALTADGWLKTGDIARRDSDGILHIVGRAKDIIIRSGFNVHPGEVEAVLLVNPHVVQAAVFGLQAGNGDETVIAVVELAPGSSATADSLMAHAASRLAGYKRPAAIHLIDQMPVGVTGKIAIGKLKSLISNSADLH